jgi:hypothetical protein
MIEQPARPQDASNAGKPANVLRQASLDPTTRAALWYLRLAWVRHRDQLGEFSEILSGGAEVEFITRAVRSSQSEHVETQNAFEVGKQHLDLLALPT